jgi:hypothetical protein
MLNKAHQGYIYQDIIGAYFIALELAQGRLDTEFLFDLKKTPVGTPDKFDDIFIKRQTDETLIQVKYSNDATNHCLTKADFASSSKYDLALYELFKTWKALNKPNTNWKVLLAWELPSTDDSINDVLLEEVNDSRLFQSTGTYKFDCNALWPKDGEVISSWRSLKKESASIIRSEFRNFLNNLSIELQCPKSNLLENFNDGIEQLLSQTILQIGIEEYPNDHLSIRQVAEGLSTIVQRQRAKENQTLISVKTIADELGIKTSFGGIEQKFPIDENLLVATPERVEQVVNVLHEKKSVVLTAEPGAGKSWFIENLQRYYEENEKQIVKHYCYTSLNDPLATKRITANVLYGSLITQITNNDSDLHHHMTKRYASNLEELNILLGEIKKNTLLIIDGIDHIWRVYQKNRGGMTEGQTSILKALSNLDLSNPNVSLLVVSQPINELEDLPEQFHRCTLSQVSEKFVEDLLERNTVLNSNFDEKLISEVIHIKSNGNALYCKYLIDHIKISTTSISVTELPEYDFNLTGYYSYLYEGIQSQSAVPYALCGADFSLTEHELKEITHYGDMVSVQIQQLSPLLKFNSATGYSIYHESFKRYIVDSIKNKGASIDHLIYLPIISWLESLNFYESSKAYGHLLKLYFEIDNKEKIIESIGVDFLKESFYYAHPIENIIQNHRLQKASLIPGFGFEPLIIVSEQSKFIYELEHIQESTLIPYLEAVQKIHGNDYMYRVLWNGEQLLISAEAALKFLVKQAYKKEKEIHWSIIPEMKSIPYETLGDICIKFLHQEEFERFDNYIKRINENPEHQKAIAHIKKDLEWWMIFNGDDWLKNTPYYNKLVSSSAEVESTSIESQVESVMQEKFQYDDNWEGIIIELTRSYLQSSLDQKEETINKLSDYNWFRNWVIYNLKTADLKQREYQNSDVVNAFSYLVRDLKPFKGTPRTCDLYKQLEFIEKSYYKGLKLCNGDTLLIKECCKLLEKVTDLTTSLQGSYSGPLVEEKYLKIISHFLPMEDVKNLHTEYYAPLGSRRVYSDVAEMAFEYAKVLKLSGKDEEAKNTFKEGVQALTAYGYRKDRTLSEVLYSSVPFQQTYNSLSLDWFYELNEMAWSVATHTDGKSTRRYPVEWFEEFVKVYPQEGLKFLAYETIENKKAHWYQEESFIHLLEEHSDLFSPTQWFLLCRTVPLLITEKIISYGLSVLDDIDFPIKEVFYRWLQALPSIENKKNEEPIYSANLAQQFQEVFNIELKAKKPKEEKAVSLQEKEENDFPEYSLEEGLAALEEQLVTKAQSNGFKNFISTIGDFNNQKKAIRLFAIKISREAYHINYDWINNLFDDKSEEGFFLNICLFVYLTDGWYHGLNKTEYFEKAYNIDNEKAINALEELLCTNISESEYAQYLVSCNLIKVLSKVNVDEETCRPLLELTYKIVKDRLPNPPSLHENITIKEGLSNFDQDEIVVALLIARLKTLTLEKTQSIIWGLTFLAEQYPESLIKPMIWALTNREYLLPVHRALILQIIKTNIDKKLIPDELVKLLLDNYPTGYFLEDQYIRSFVNYNIDLDETHRPSLILKPSKNDEIPLWANPKYYNLYEKLGGFLGSYSSYELKRKKINDEYENYYLRSEKLMTPIVPLANAMYEVINTNYYKQLREMTGYFGSSYVCNLSFKTTEIGIQLGAINNRPSDLPLPSGFTDFEIKGFNKTINDGSWILLASEESEIVGEYFDDKTIITSKLTLYFGSNPTSESYVYSNYEFGKELYFDKYLETAPKDNAICSLGIRDTLEQSKIVFLAPWVIRELNLNISTNFHNGFIAHDSDQNEVVKLIKWREKYVGDIGNSTEVPTLSGVAVMIKDTWYEKLLSLTEESVYILSSNSIGAV